MTQSSGYHYTNLLRVLLLVLIVSAFLTTFSNAAIRTVTNLNDNGPGSLRDIIDNIANPGDDIVFDQTIAGGTINLTSGILFVDIDLTITGPADNPIILDGNNMTRIMSIFGGANVVLSNLVFQNGRVTGTMNETGGAIGTSFPFPNIEINNCTFRNNSVQCTGTSCQARGGAIAAAGGLIIRGSTFENNFTQCTVDNQFCSARAGAIEHQSEEPLVLENNTICDNEVRCTGIGSSTCGLEGGALYVDNDLSTMNNNTFSDNNILCDSQTCNLLGSTIFVRDITSAAPNVLNTIIDNDPGVSVPNCSGTIADNGNNIQFPGNSCGGTIATVNPELGPLLNNGGITETKAIGFDSPAFNAGNNATCLDIDQRGVSRPQAIICDIGSYEFILGPNVKNIPTLSEWGLIALAGLIGITGFLVMRRRKVTA